MSNTISNHLLRRRARARANAEEAKLIDKGLSLSYAKAYIRVVRAERGPWRWRVVRL